MVETEAVGEDREEIVMQGGVLPDCLSAHEEH